MIEGLVNTQLWRTGSFIGGEWIRGRDTYAVVDPASGDELAKVARAGEAEARAAIDAATRAFPAWRDATAAERAVKVRRWGELMLANQRDLALIMTREQGKPLAEAMGEVVLADTVIRPYFDRGQRFLFRPPFFGWKHELADVLNRLDLIREYRGPIHCTFDCSDWALGELNNGADDFEALHPPRNPRTTKKSSRGKGKRQGRHYIQTVKRDKEEAKATRDTRVAEALQKDSEKASQAKSARDEAHAQARNQIQKLFETSKPFKAL